MVEEIISYSSSQINKHKSFSEASASARYGRICTRRFHGSRCGSVNISTITRKRENAIHCNFHFGISKLCSWWGEHFGCVCCSHLQKSLCRSTAHILGGTPASATVQYVPVCKTALCQSRANFRVGIVLAPVRCILYGGLGRHVGRGGLCGRGTRSFGVYIVPGSRPSNKK